MRSDAQEDCPRRAGIFSTMCAKKEVLCLKSSAQRKSLEEYSLFNSL
jgi:hypothetical protein